MSKYIISKEALVHLSRIHEYGVDVFGVIQADKYLLSFFDYFDKIAARPYTYAIIPNINGEFRRCVCGPDSMIFKIIETHVEIVTIVGRQNINKNLK